ncbi:MAG: tRNA dihydrouridine synthase DusB [Opitutaceae bacterium]
MEIHSARPPVSRHPSPPAAGVGLQPVCFGGLELKTNLFLSPLAGYTTLPFRLAVRALGGLDLATTDLVNAHSLLRHNPMAYKLVATCPEDSPLAVQLFGADPIVMRDAAQMIEAMGIASVDINMGCPVKKVVRTGSGATLMTSTDTAAELVRTMVGGLRIPVTAKMRLGWDQNSLTAPDLARALEDAGAAAIFVHGRTRAQGFSGRVDLKGIAAVVRAVTRIPVIGNGDVTTPQGAARMLEETGCAGVSIGRGAFYNPWIFSQTAGFLKTGEIPAEPDFEERIALMCGHLDRMITFHGEALGCRLFRKMAPWYARQFGPAVFFKRAVAGFQTREEFAGILDDYRSWRLQFVDEAGVLLPAYQPRSPYSSFMDAEGADRSEGIAVPRGPTAIW